jgi:hypothetical protein
MRNDDRPTPPDPIRPARAPSSHDVEPGSETLTADKSRALRDLESAGRRARERQAVAPRPAAPYRPPQPTLRESPAPPPSHPADHPFGTPASRSLPPPSSDPKDARIAAMERELDDYRKGRKFSPAAGTPAPAAPVGVSDEVIGRVVRQLLERVAKRVGAPAALLACLGGGGYAFSYVKEEQAPPPPAYVTKDELDKALRGRKDKALAKAVNPVARLAKCVLKQQDKTGKMLLPAPDHVGSALKPQPWENECLELAERVKILEEDPLTE